MRDKCDFLLILLSTVVISGIFGALCGDDEKGEGFQNPPDGVCSNVDIRSTMDQFRRLENCSVVEGFLHISLIERAVHEDYEKWSFPELREITGYIRLYRVYGLKTLRTLFPNLTVIGGRQLFNNYALVAYEMPDLEELGLVSLRTISRGGVRITKSKKLCYIDTVDWGRLGVDPGAQDFKDNKEESQCANYCPEKCLTTRVANVEAKRCWTSHHCQLGLNCRCKVNQTCMDNGTCCHDYCVGGCVGAGPGGCYSCKGVTYQGKCHSKCPPLTFMFSDRRCLTEKECHALVKNTDTGKNTKILRGEQGEPSICVIKCPQNYTVREEGQLKNLECIKCQDFCPKVCNYTEVNSIEDAEKLKDCSKIIGPLIIQIMSGSNIAQELEKNLGNIKEVTGYISIRRSYVLHSLYFLKSLEIFGDFPLHQRYSLIVMDNTNLQELFPEEQMKKINIKRGKVSFHGNRKLCVYKINNFVKYLNLSEPPSEQDISQATNGDLLSCIERHLNLSVTDIYHNTVVLKWTKDTSDPRYLLTYIINYKEIKDTGEINIYEGRDVCSSDLWMSREQLPVDDSELFQTYTLRDLKVYTTYAVYVQAYTLPTAIHDAITSVETFTTNPYYPSEPLDLEVSSTDPHGLTVKWKPPKFPNGNVTHYKIVYHKQELAIKSFQQRDYCREPNSAPKETSKEKDNEAEKKLNLIANCCVCPKSKEELAAEARKQEIEIYFENYLQHEVYCQRFYILPPDIALNGTNFGAGWSGIIDMERTVGGDNITTKKSHEVLVPVIANLSSDKNTSDINVPYNNNLTGDLHEVLVYNATRITLPNLEHFQEYNIEVQACHDTSEAVDTKFCSNRAMTAGRTKPLRIMDSINESTINIQILINVTADILITWLPPPNPNGVILTYNIFYKRANQENLVPQQICVSSKAFDRYYGYHLTGLDYGNWTFQINAVSLAGNGSLTQAKYFIVPYPQDKGGVNSMIGAITVLVVLTVVIIVIGLLLFLRFRFRSEALIVISPNNNYISSEQMYTMDDWEVDRDKIKLIRELGQGSFGMVYEGLATGLGDDPTEETQVAVKTVNDRANFNDRREFLKEATTMKAFDCFHVVKLLGVVSTGQPALVIMELMVLGDLKNYLREQRPDENERPGVIPPNLLDILQMAGEIADGMAYLSDKKFVHRDLAARNCMVAQDKTVKIGDFGMTRDIYETDYYRKGGKGMLPVRWMAPESIKDGVFTSMSDVWSYGVVMWEMVTLAAQPYPGLSNEEVVKYISEDNTMDIPDRCPAKMAYLMQHCWGKKPKTRPTFKDIIQYLLPHLSSRFQKVSYFFTDGGGPISGDGSETGLLGHVEGDEDGDSINSLNYGGAAGLKMPLTPNSENYPFLGLSPGYDSGVGPAKINSQETIPNNRSLNVVEDFRDVGNNNADEFNLNDSNRPFLLDDFQTVPFVTTWQPSVVSLEQAGNELELHNLGATELQPLINKTQDLSYPKLAIQNSPKPDSSEYMTHKPPTASEEYITHKPPSVSDEYMTHKPPSASEEYISHKPPPSASEEYMTHKPPSASEEYMTHKPPSASEEYMTHKPPSASEEYMTHKSPSASEEYMTHKPPSASEEYISHKPPPSASEEYMTHKPPSTASKEYISHKPPSASEELTIDPQNLQKHDIMNQAVVDHLRPGPVSDSSPLMPAIPVPASKVTLPRLPTLNQPPSGGFQRIPLYKSGDRNNYSSRNTPPISNNLDYCPPVSVAVIPNVVGAKDGAYPPSSAQQNKPPSGAIINSSDHSKESSNTSASHSFHHGQTNGHIPLSTLSPRTAPC